MGKGAAITTVATVCITLAIQVGMVFSPWWYHKQYYFALINPVTIEASLFHLHVDARQTCGQINVEKNPGLQDLKTWCDKWNGDHFIHDTRDIACSYNMPVTAAVPGMMGLYHMCVASHGMLKAGWTILVGTCINVSMQLAALTLQAIYWNRGTKKKWFNHTYHNVSYRCTAAGSLTYMGALLLYGFFMRDMANIFGGDWVMSWVVNSSQYPGYHISWAVSVCATVLQFVPLFVLACSKAPHEKQWSGEKEEEDMEEEDDEEGNEQQPFLANAANYFYGGAQPYPHTHQQQPQGMPVMVGGGGAPPGMGGFAQPGPMRGGAPPGMALPGMHLPQGFGAANVVNP